MTLNRCEDKHLLPSLGLIFKGYSKDGKDEAFELILTPNDYVLEFEVNGKNDCVVGIGSDSEDNGWTLGQVFLKAYYTVFDRESEAIGFVKSNPNPTDEVLNLAEAPKSIDNHNVVAKVPGTNQMVSNSLFATQNMIQNGPFPANYMNTFTNTGEGKSVSFLKNSN